MRALARGDTLAAPWLISAGAVLLVILDVVLGSPLQLNTVFGYSPIVAGRFAGYGNQVYSLLAVSTLVVATAGWELWGRRWPGSVRWRPWAVLVLFAAVVVADGAPSLGSDVGGVLAAVPAFAVCFLMLRGRRVRWRTALAIVVGTVVVLGVFAAVDLARPASSRTHLGRFVASLGDGGAATILQRKLDANLSVLTSTVWTWVIPAALLFLAYITWRPNGLLGAVMQRHPSFRPFGTSALVLGVAAWALNDSGVSMPAMMLATALPYTAVLVLEVVGEPAGSAQRSVPAPADTAPAGTAP